MLGVKSAQQLESIPHECIPSSRRNFFHEIHIPPGLSQKDSQSGQKPIVTFPIKLGPRSYVTGDAALHELIVAQSVGLDGGRPHKVKSGMVGPMAIHSRFSLYAG